jgi:hypothetical protein
MPTDMPAQNPAEPPSAAQATINEGAQAPPSPPVPEAHVPTGIEEQGHSHNQTESVREWWKVIVETLSRIVGQLDQMHEATKATKDAAAATQTAAAAAKESADLTWRTSAAASAAHCNPAVGPRYRLPHIYFAVTCEEAKVEATITSCDIAALVSLIQTMRNRLDHSKTALAAKV